MADVTAEEMRSFVLETLQGLTAQERELLADVFASANWDAQRSRSLGDAQRNQYPHRILQAGSPVTTDGSGALAALNTTSLFDTLNFVNGTVKINDENRRQADIQSGGGGADCMFDYIVSDCWAAEVTAGRGTEGQTFTSLTGCTFKVYSTIQAAITAADADNEDRIIFVCPGTYAENVTVSNTFDHGLRIVGAGRDSVRIAPSTGVAFANDQSSAQASTRRFFIEEITMDGATYGLSIATAGLAGDGDTTTYHRCNFIGDSGGILIGGDNTSGANDQKFYDCYTQSILISGSSSNVKNFYWYGGRIDSFDYTGAVGKCDNIWIDGEYTGLMRFPPTNDFYLGGGWQWNASAEPTRQLVFGNGPGGVTHANHTFQRVRLDTRFDAMDATSAARYYWEIEADTHIKGGMDTSTYPYPTNVTNTVNYIKVQTSAAHFEGFSFQGTFGVDASGLSLEDNTTYKSIQCTGTGRISDSRFACTPPDFEFDVGTPTAINTLANGTQFSTGVPTHTANGGQLYYDATGKNLYKNDAAINTPGTTWTLIGVSGGGAAAPASGKFITYASDATLSDNRVLTAGDGITLTDAGTDDGALTVASYLFPLQSPGELTIATGAITLPANTGYVHVDTEGAAASDDLDTINGLEANRIFILKVDNDARTVILKHNTGNILCNGNNDIRLDDVQDFAVCVTDGSTVYAMHALGPHQMLGAAAHTDSQLSSVTRGDLIYGNTTPAWDDLPIGATPGMLLRSDGTDLAWATVKNLVSAYFDGANASTTTPMIVTPPMPHSGVITAVYSKTGENITVGATAWVGDIHKILTANANTDGQGTSIFTTKPTITNGNMYQAYGAPDLTTTFAAGDMFAFYTDQAGTNVTYVTMGIEVRWT